jgi:hypothetical protein
MKLAVHHPIDPFTPPVALATRNDVSRWGWPRHGSQTPGPVVWRITASSAGLALRGGGSPGTSRDPWDPLQVFRTLELAHPGTYRPPLTGRSAPHRTLTPNELVYGDETAQRSELP